MIRHEQRKTLSLINFLVLFCSRKIITRYFLHLRSVLSPKLFPPFSIVLCRKRPKEEKLKRMLRKIDINCRFGMKAMKKNTQLNSDYFPFSSALARRYFLLFNLGRLSSSVIFYKEQICRGLIRNSLINKKWNKKFSAPQARFALSLWNEFKVLIAVRSYMKTKLKFMTTFYDNCLTSADSI